MDVKKAFEEQWADVIANSTPYNCLSNPGMKDIAYGWFLEGWELSQKKGEGVVIDKVIGFLNRMKS